MKRNYIYTSLSIMVVVISTIMPSYLLGSNSSQIDTLKIENKFLSVLISTKGAEIISIKNKKDNTEIIWHGEEKSWDQHAPILFPIVGKLKNGSYNLEGETYKMGNHGFAYKSTFTVISKTKSEVVLEMTGNPEILKIYPYSFELQVKYELVNSKLNITNTVANTSNKDMYFSIGAHPGFNVPINNKGKYDDYFIEFNKKENADRLPLTKKEGMLSNVCIDNYLNDTKTLKLNHKMFSDRVIILEGLKSNSLTIKSKKSSTAIEIGIKDFPLVGVWTSSRSDAPFVCIEPWYGVTDYIDTDGDFKNKKAIQKLARKESFDMKYYIKLTENK
ncbi:MAG: aldose 1-epimerase family protein [Flavobacteriales bacterium]|nr:aldose 1-epimerase family protein [Flavobacteriales bacterium]